MGSQACTSDFEKCVQAMSLPRRVDDSEQLARVIFSPSMESGGIVNYAAYTLTLADEQGVSMWRLIEDAPTRETTRHMHPRVEGDEITGYGEISATDCKAAVTSSFTLDIHVGKKANRRKHAELRLSYQEAPVTGDADYPGLMRIRTNWANHTEYHPFPPMKPKVSIIVPVYNTEKWLDKCVESLVNQTEKNIEIILVDDGSTDGSPAKCDEWARKDNRVKVIHKSNSGLVLSRKTGAEVAEGDWLSFVDSDDWVRPEMYESMLRASENKDIVRCDAVIHFSDKEIESPIFFSPDSQVMFHKFVLGDIPSWAVLQIIRKSYLQKLEIKISDDTFFCEDLIFQMHLMFGKPRLAKVNESFYVYNRCNDSSCTANGKVSPWINADPMLHDMADFLQRNNMMSEYGESWRRKVMICKIETARSMGMNEARNKFPSVHRQLSMYPFHPLYNVYYWMCFNLGTLGNFLFSLISKRSN